MLIVFPHVDEGSSSMDVVVRTIANVLGYEMGTSNLQKRLLLFSICTWLVVYAFVFVVVASLWAGYQLHGWYAQMVLELSEPSPLAGSREEYSYGFYNDNDPSIQYLNERQRLTRSLQSRLTQHRLEMVWWFISLHRGEKEFHHVWYMFSIIL